MKLPLIASLVLAAAAAVPASADVPGIRETVRSLTISVSRTCPDGKPRYALYPIAPKYGPSLSAAADGLSSDYLYPEANGLRLSLAGDGPGAGLSMGAANGTMRLVGSLGAEDGECREYPASSARVELAPGVVALLSVQPRTGIFHPACYHDPINGFYKLDTWTILTVSFPQEGMTVKTADSKAFGDKDKCLEFYSRLKDAR